MVGNIKMAKPNKFQNTKFHNLSISILEYNLLKKFTLGSVMLIRAYNSVVKGIKLHQILDKDILQNTITEKEIRLSFFNKVKLPFTNVDRKSLKIGKSGDNHKDTNNILNNLIKLKGKSIILNIHSPIGDEALKATSYIFEELTRQKLVGRATTGIEINKLSVDFDNKMDIDLLDKDFLLINSFNSIYVTDYRKQFIDNLFEEAKIKKIPIILSNNVELNNQNFKILNCKFLDEKPTHSQVLKEFLED